MEELYVEVMSEFFYNAPPQRDFIMPLRQLAKYLVQDVITLYDKINPESGIKQRVEMACFLYFPHPWLARILRNDPAAPECAEFRNWVREMRPLVDRNIYSLLPQVLEQFFMELIRSVALLRYPIMNLVQKQEFDREALISAVEIDPFFRKFLRDRNIFFYQPFGLKRSNLSFRKYVRISDDALQLLLCLVLLDLKQ